ncbi:CusA/CzcA family heavy metal efflux RND transporter [Cyclobacterium jeungdonense]|uniref:CusA/CzcA family heavy metal efflux RND transporter n=1 Tax=Cyclobacterium jeungdonense TaxID=708087 RepID=A0ABT8C3J7_9BACT|nr:CusA/CzcA family heavy metal efflux RND transporter [Cyclobacterium jeungdonense]MDN3686343.1 CusA/CzcA family heavy metal efflux RND transporter [Cyclobacterium jeungdonense]
MIHRIIAFSVKNKFIVLLAVLGLVIWGLFSFQRLSIGSVPDITSNQVQIITVARNLATEEVEQFITFPIELSVANLPGVEEIRSVSKYGLSTITVVFEEGMGTYLPRQLIGEKLAQASKDIPAHFGSPEMAPISTGLGEIYQYTLETRPGYEDRYSVMELREIQDWLIKRQLTGIKGVVEINTWGGYLKQYEVAMQPEKLRSMDVSLLEVLQALEDNNENAGGAYLEKNQTNYFIRGEGMIQSLEDIRKIVVTNRGGVPLTIGDLAEVRFGYATRFGAITGNGEGEKVLGQVMMLKGENSYAVIKSVKERIAEIEKILPEGVYINGFLDRSMLIDKTTSTIQENLVLGALFVIFILVILMGNFRSGLLVASVIPLSLLFGISLMSFFQVDANLLSLGAIDFGILIDGAVVVVEYVVYQMSKKFPGLKGNAQKEEVDKLVIESSNRMMNAAIFGQIIILIVFIPILSFTGVEGKMFQPMALTFMFILAGAMILCLTYVPVMAALFIRPSKNEKGTLSAKIIRTVHGWYQPVLIKALNHYKLVLITALIGFGISLFIFSRLGGEFLPTLDEGDYVIQPVLKPGTSLAQTVEITTKIESILLEKFPDEVEQVVSRIGAAEIPTDPMSMEMSDIIIKLKDPYNWSRAAGKTALANQMTEELSVLPGITYQFTQPIEMRFNELLTGVQSDLAIKIFGEDLETLYRYGLEAATIIRDVEGIDNIKVEQLVGLPQISISYDRDKLALYGLGIADVNQVIRTAFAGSKVGTIFENERRFDLALRLDRETVSTEVVNELSLPLENGEKILLKQVADISFQSGPAQISRDDTKRRIVLSLNATERDVESIVTDVRELLDAQLDLPTGYSIAYGGQFENLNQARDRLIKVVPLALLLIAIMLYFTFHSVSETIMVFLSIPLAVIGGIVALWIRGMPFSISAGIGFIALFGIAVLNGIVLISYLNDLETSGETNIRKRILKGCKNRLRPVLLTASTDILGFIPMALSTSAGAEVQRPIATVVIGGLITAFFLTLIVLPVVYFVVKTKKLPSFSFNKAAFFLILLTGIPFLGQAQDSPIGPKEAWNRALENNFDLAAVRLAVENRKVLTKTAWDLPSSLIFVGTEENQRNLEGDGVDAFGFQQYIDFPGVYVARKKVLEKERLLAEDTYDLRTLALKKQVYKACYQLDYLVKKKRQYAGFDSLYQDLFRASEKRYASGMTNRLAMVMAKARSEKIRVNYSQLDQQIQIAYRQLQEVVQSSDTLQVTVPALGLEFSELPSLENHPSYDYLVHQKERFSAERKQMQNKLLPGFYVQYMFQKVDGISGFFGYQAGIQLPLWFGPTRARVQSARLSVYQSENKIDDLSIRWESALNQKKTALEMHIKELDYYTREALPLAKEIVSTAQKSFDNGEIDYLEYIRSLEYATEIEMDHLDLLNKYNQTVLDIHYFTLP